MILLHIINKKHLAFNEVKLTPLKINVYVPEKHFESSRMKSQHHFLHQH